MSIIFVKTNITKYKKKYIYKTYMKGLEKSLIKPDKISPQI